MRPLHGAAFRGQTKAIKALLTAGASVEMQTSEPLGSEVTLTPLQLAVGEGHTEAIKVLVAAGATVDAQVVGMARNENVRQALIETQKALGDERGAHGVRKQALQSASLLSFGASSGMSTLLATLGIEEALPAAAAWFAKEGATSLNDIVELDLIDDFVAALDLKRVPALKLAQAMKQKRKERDEL
uniref:SAM domain-containing protein n=1 Tax=Prymnesium polylepis TaxID=72548 RepID=A0A7S4HSV7_9EUKA